MRPGQDPEDYLYHMDSCRDCLNACDPPEGPMGRQYEDIVLQALPSEYDLIRQTHLERRDFGLADIRRMMAAIYVDNLSRSQSSQGIVGRGAAMQAVDRDRTINSVVYHYRDQFGRFKRKCPLRIKHHQQQRQQPVRHHQQQQHGEHQQKPRGRRQNNGGGVGGRVRCSYHKITSHNDADCRVQQHKDGATLMWPPPDLSASKESAAPTTCPRRMASPEHPYISFTATEVQSKT